MSVHPRNECADGGDVEHLPLYYYDLTPRLIQQAKEELFEDKDTTKTALFELRALIEEANKNNMEFPTDDAELILFLRARKFDARKAYDMYRKYFAQFSTYDKLFKDVDFSSILKVLQSNVTGYLPKRDDEGCAVAILLCQNWNPSVLNYTDILKAGVISIIDIMRCPITQISGWKIIADFSNLTLNKLITMRPWHLMYAAEFMQNSTPLRIKELHVLNHGRLFHFIWRVIRPVLSKKMIKRIHFHGQDLGSLHRFFSPSILPEEWGGNTGPYDTSEWLEIFAQSENYVMGKINKFNAKHI